MTRSPQQSDLDQAWDFADPAGTEARLAAMAADAERAGWAEYAAEVRTQIARAQGLQRKFAEGHATLDAVEAWLAAGAGSTGHGSLRVLVRLLLERGRVLNSSGDSAAAGPLFGRAWAMATAPDACPAQDGLAVDAAHMLAIVESGEKAREWNRLALELAESSANPDARRWRASLLSNLGWTECATGEYARAHEYFERALAARIEHGTEGRLRRPWLVARWCVARSNRAAGRVDEALTEQRRLHDEHATAGTVDGFVHEELGECLLTLGRAEEAAPHLAAAHAALSRDPWLSEREPARIERLRRLAGGS